MKEGLSGTVPFSAGGSYSVFLDAKGNVWTCGYNVQGQLGMGQQSRNQPSKIPTLANVIFISAGFNHTLFLNSQGTVFACGYNNAGQLGLNDNKSRRAPSKIETLSNIISMCSAGSHSLFLDSEGTVWCCGENNYGQLGLADEVNRNVPTKIENMPKIKSISACGSHSLFLDEEGKVWSCGYNSHGQLGLGNTHSSSRPVQIPSLPTITAISSGMNFSLFLDSTGKVWSCGYNFYGQLGHKPDQNYIVNPVEISNLENVAAIAAGHAHSLFLDSEGNAWSCGYNHYGQLGFGNLENTHVPSKITSCPNVIFLSAGGNHSLFLNKNHEMFACGYNGQGQLALGDTMQRESPVSIVTSLQSSKLYSVSRKRSNSDESFTLLVKRMQNQSTMENIDLVQISQSAEMPNKYQDTHSPRQRKTKTRKPSAPSTKLENSNARTRVFSAKTLPGKLTKKFENEKSGDYGPNSPQTKFIQKKSVFMKDTMDYVCFKELMLELRDKHPTDQLRKRCKLLQIEKMTAEQFKNKIFEGELLLGDWKLKADKISKRSKKNSFDIKRLDTELISLQRNLQNYRKLVRETKQQLEDTGSELAKLKSKQKIYSYFDEFLPIISKLDSELKHSFTEKIHNNAAAEVITTDDVSLFLNLAKLDDFIPFFRSKKVDGSTFLNYAKSTQLSDLGELPVARRSEFLYKLSLLEYGILPNDKVLKHSPITEDPTTENLLKLLSKYQIFCDEKIVSQMKLTAPQFIFLKLADLRVLFPSNQASRDVFDAYQKVKKLRTEFNAFLIDYGKKRQAKSTA